jgi:hypothetical protein
MNFEDSAARLAASCAKDIEANCRGVNLDPSRMKAQTVASKTLATAYDRVGFLPRKP